MTQAVVTRKQAVKAGLKRYFTGKPCPVGHVAERCVANNACAECLRDYDREHVSERNARSIKYGKVEKRQAYLIAYRQKRVEAHKLYQRAYRERNAERIQQQIKEWKAKHPDHITRQTDARRKRLIKHAGRPQPETCEICERKVKYLCFDHCHVAKEFRGWLCQQCNTALGMVRDSPEILRRLAAYLERKV